MYTVTFKNVRRAQLSISSQNVMFPFLKTLVQGLTYYSRIQFIKYLCHAMD